MNPWKLTSIGMAVAIVSALVTGLVVANWTGSDRAAQEQKAAVQDQKPAAQEQKTQHKAQATQTHVASAPGVPTQTAIDACNKYAASEAGSKDKTMEVVKDGAIGAVVGAAVGAAGGAIAGGGKGAGKGAAIGGVVGVGGGTLYGLNENKKNDEKYKAAYSSCMHSRGYTG